MRIAFSFSVVLWYVSTGSTVYHSGKFSSEISRDFHNETFLTLTFKKLFNFSCRKMNSILHNFTSKFAWFWYFSFPELKLPNPDCFDENFPVCSNLRKMVQWHLQNFEKVWCRQYHHWNRVPQSLHSQIIFLMLLSGVVCNQWDGRTLVIWILEKMCAIKPYQLSVFALTLPPGDINLSQVR